MKASRIAWLVLTALPLLSQATTAELGKKIYSAEADSVAKAAANSCLFCHGTKEEKGKNAAAAQLTRPKQWKTFAAIGGEAEFKKDKAAFLKRMEEAVVSLIAKGAIAHGATFKPAWKYDKKAINGQMMGLTGAPSIAYLKKNGITKEDAAKAVYLYIQSMDTEGVFK